MRIISMFSAGVLFGSALVLAQTPTYNLIDPAADARTVNVFRYLQSQYGKKMLTGCWTESQYGGAQAFHTCSGEWPAIWGQDMNSWYLGRTDALWIDTWNQNIAGFKNAWSRSEILQVNWHWQNVAHKSNGRYTEDAWSDITTQEWTDIVTPGTALYNAMIEDVDYHVVNFLKKITDSHGPIPILFRPLHEIDGGWFWWTCTSDPGKTAELFRIIKNRIINYHNMHNLIWVYSAGVGCDGGSWPPYATSEYARRQAFYPGDGYCDIIGIDLYDWDWINKGTYAPNGTDYGKTYKDAWNVMRAVSSTKMIALTECQGFPDPAKSFTDATFAPWLYALPWYSNESNGVPCNVLTARANNSYMINASDLPDFNQATTIRTVDFKSDGRTRLVNQSGRYMISGALGMMTVRLSDTRGKIVFAKSVLNGDGFEIPGDLARGTYLLSAGSGFVQTIRKE